MIQTIYHIVFIFMWLKCWCFFFIFWHCVQTNARNPSLSQADVPVSTEMLKPNIDNNNGKEWSRKTLLSHSKQSIHKNLPLPSCLTKRKKNDAFFGKSKQNINGKTRLIQIPTHDINTTESNALARMFLSSSNGFFSFSCVSIAFLHLFDSHHQFSKFTTHSEHSLTREKNINAFSTFFSLEFFYPKLLSSFFGVGNDFCISKSLAQVKHNVFLSRRIAKVLGVIHVPVRNEEKTEQRKIGMIERQTYRTQIQMHDASDECIKESAKLNANTMDGWMNRKWKYFGRFLFFFSFLNIMFASHLVNV